MAMLSSLVCVKDFETEANKVLSKDVSGYLGSGALLGNTLKENEEAFKRWYIRPRYLVDVSKCDLSTTILGYDVKMPFGISPVGMQKVIHPDGESATAKAASRIGTVFTYSTVATTSLEIVSSESELNFFQLYAFKNRNITAELIQRAEKFGYKALVVTVDAPIIGIRYADRRNGFKLPSHYRLTNIDEMKLSDDEMKSSGGYISAVASSFYDTITWEDIKWLRSLTTMPIVLKGILTAEDALKGVDAGVAAIWVSNHGGRQLDGVMPTIEALPEVVAAVGNKCEVYVDGGFRTGADIFKALAIGANMVFLGRPFMWGLACGGYDGAYRVMNLLQEELKNVMSLSGCCSVKDISRSFIARGTPSKL